MGLLFENRHVISTTFKLKPTQHHSDKDTVLIGQNIWSILLAVDTDRVTVSISSARGQKKPPLDAITCWAILDKETDDLSIPKEWMGLYGNIFSPSALSSNSPPKNISLQLVQPIVLTEVVVAALSTDCYSSLRAQDSILESWFSSYRPILRQGERHPYIKSHPQFNTVQASNTHYYRLDTIQPVLQGYAEKGTTKFIVTMAQDTDESKQTEIVGEDNFEIDESFLANSVLPLIPDAASSDGLRSQSNAGPLKNSGTSGSEFSFQIHPLSQIVSVLHDDSTLYLRTADLSKLGALNNDSASVRSTVTTKSRLVRLTANDDIVHTSGAVMASPTLLHNIYSELDPESNILISTGPFMSHQPTAPTAHSVTVARVASPFSVDRNYQPLFLHVLKQHFASGKRLVKQGDLIGVPIDTNILRRIHEEELSSSGLDGILDQDYPAVSPRPNEVVFFVITNVEHDLQASTSNSFMDKSSLGELGCWIDPVVTRLVQTGLENCRIPDVAPYLGVEITYGNRRVESEKSTHVKRLVALSSAALRKCAVDHDLNLTFLLSGARGTGKFTAVKGAARYLGVHVLEINCYDLLDESTTKTEGVLRVRFEKAASCSPCAIVLRHIDALAQTTQASETGKDSPLANAFQDCIVDLKKTWKLTGYPVFVFGTTSESSKVPAGILACFKHEILLEAPDDDERYRLLLSLLDGATISLDVSISMLATQTAALVASDLASLVSHAIDASKERVSNLITSEVCDADIVQAGIALTAADFDVALGKVRTSYSESIGAPKIPNVSWDDVGGLAQVKSDILDTIQLPLERPELFAHGLKKRSGILLYGPPGTGKTLLAKAVATSCSLNFFSVKGPELLNMYIGESEANVRRVFQRARDAKPCVVFFDELDSVAPKRGNQGDSGGVMDRIVSQLLAELDGMSSGKGGADVFVIGATNRPDLLDAALLRPGRFDRMLYLGVSQTHEAQFNILEALTRKFRLDPDLDLRQIAERCPFNYTGADFYALCSDAMLYAMSRKAEEIEGKIAKLNDHAILHQHPYPITPQYYLAEMAFAEETKVLVCQSDFDLALRNLVPSVTQSEMDHYANIQRRFSRTAAEETIESGGGYRNS